MGDSVTDKLSRCPTCGSDKPDQMYEPCWWDGYTNSDPWHHQGSVRSVALRGREGGATAELGDCKAHALRSSQGGGDKPHVLGPMGVRRLTPRECERLQGFPDDWTRWDADGNELPDSARYRMMGNAVAVPVAEWVARQLLAQIGANA